MITLNPPPTPEEIALARKEVGSHQSVPWGTLATNLAAIGGSHYLGYLTAGMLTRAAGNTPLGRWLGAQSPETQKRVLKAAFIGSGVGSGLMLTGQQVASQARMHEGAEKLNTEYEQKVLAKIQEMRARKGTKTASVHRAYGRAMA